MATKPLLPADARAHLEDESMHRIHQTLNPPGWVCAGPATVGDVTCRATSSNLVYGQYVEAGTTWSHEDLARHDNDPDPANADFDELRAAGHPAGQTDDYEHPDLTAVVHAHSRHFTASAVVIDPDRRVVLLVDHNAEGARQFPGGHIDPDETGDEAALREVLEETGVEATIVIPQDALTLLYGRALPNPLMIAEFRAPAKPGKGQPAHRHVDLLYVATADSTAPLTHQPEENTGAFWVPIDTLDTAAVRPDVPGAVQAALALLGQPGVPDVTKADR